MVADTKEFSYKSVYVQQNQIYVLYIRDFFSLTQFNCGGHWCPKGNQKNKIC